MQSEVRLHVSPSQGWLRVEDLLYLPPLQMALTVEKFEYFGQAVIDEIVHGQYLDRVVVSVKRTTGQARITAYATPPSHPEPVLWMLFSGSCEPLKAKF